MNHGIGEEIKPRLPVASPSDLIQQLIVPLAMRLKVQAQIEHRFLENLLRAEQQGHNEASQPPVSIKKGVNGFKLNVRQCRFDQNRSLSPREAARLQTFPDDYHFETALGSPGKTPVFHQIGNAVPVLFAEKIASKLSEHIHQQQNVIV